MNPALDNAIKRAMRPTSFYWCCPDDIDQTDANTIYEVEIRIDVAADGVGGVSGMENWVVAKRDVALEAVFLRRRQSLDKASIGSLIRDGITIAFNHSGQFHSWIDVGR